MKLIFCLAVLLVSLLQFSSGAVIQFSQREYLLNNILKNTENTKQQLYYCKDKWPAPSHYDPEMEMNPVSPRKWCWYFHFLTNFCTTNRFKLPLIMATLRRLTRSTRRIATSWLCSAFPADAQKWPEVRSKTRDKAPLLPHSNSCLFIHYLDFHQTWLHIFTLRIALQEELPGRLSSSNTDFWTAPAPG